MDIRQTTKYANYLKTCGWKVKKINNVNCFYKYIPFFGIIVKIQRASSLNLLAIEKFSKEINAKKIVVEPAVKSDAKKLINSNYKLSNSPFVPSKTLVCDLSKNIDAIFKSLTKDARYSIRKNSDTEIIEVDNKKLKNFWESWKSNTPLSRYIPSLTNLTNLQKIFGQDILVLASNFDGNISAGSVFLKSEDTAYYWFSFTGKVGRQRLHQYKIVWEGIAWAKKSGCKYFDFEGVFDKRFPIPKWKGFSFFKRQFGGKEKTYPGCFIKNRGILAYLIN